MVNFVKFLPRDACSAKHGIAIVVVRPSVTLRYHGHIGWISSKVIAGLIRLGFSLLGAPTLAI